MDINSQLYRKAFINYIRRGIPFEITYKEELKNKRKYIWRTQGDNRVRPSHAANEGRIFSYNNSPLPGEEAGCRCWAEPYFGDVLDSDNWEENIVPETWANQKTFKDHFNRHKDDFGAKSGKEYAQKAQEFRQKAIKENLPSIEYPNGQMGMYDKATNIFGIYTKEGKTITFYKPTPKNYFQGQIDKYIPLGGKIIKSLNEILKYYEQLIERKYFTATESCYS